MARAFTAASNHKLQTSTLPVSAVPLSIACWFWVSGVTSEYCLAAISDTAGDLNYFALTSAGNLGGDPVAAYTRSATGSASATTSTSVTANAWHHAAGVWAGINDRRAYLDGGGKGTNTSSRTPAGLDIFTAGDLVRSTANALALDGRLAELAVWSVALTDDEVAMLAAGVSPLAVQPTALLFYAPLLGEMSPEIDIIGSNGMTVTGATAAVDHPPIRPALGRFAVPPPGITVVNATVTGVKAMASAAGVAGVVTAQNPAAVTGTKATATAAGIAGAVTAQISVSITGTKAVATATGTAGLVSSVSIVSVAGTGAATSAAGGAGAVTAQVAAPVTGTAASAAAAGTAGSVSTVNIASITGAPGTATAAGVAGVALTGLLIIGAPATATAAGAGGSVTAVSSTSITGVKATAAATAVVGSVTAEIAKSISGMPAASAAAGVSGAVTAMEAILILGMAAMTAALGIGGRVITAVPGVPGSYRGGAGQFLAPPPGAGHFNSPRPGQGRFHRPKPGTGRSELP